MTELLPPEEYEKAVQNVITTFEGFRVDLKKAQVYFPGNSLETINLYVKGTITVLQMLLRDMLWLTVKIVHGMTVSKSLDPTNNFERLADVFQSGRVDCVKLGAVAHSNIMTEALKLGARVGEEVYCDTLTTWLGHPDGTPPVPLVTVRPVLSSNDDVFTMLRKIICVQKGIPYQPAKPDIMFFQEDVPMNERNKTIVDLCMQCVNTFKIVAAKMLKVQFRTPYCACEYDELAELYVRFERNVGQIPFFSTQICAQSLFDHFRPLMAEAVKKADPGVAVPSKKVQSERECANCAATCETNGVVLKTCSRCKLVQYCSKACQVQHWKEGKHKRFCVVVADRVVVPAAVGTRSSTESQCVVCLEAFTESTTKTLPCGHVLHAACAQGIKDFASAQTCPMCRKGL